MKDEFSATLHWNICDSREEVPYVLKTKSRVDTVICAVVKWIACVTDLFRCMGHVKYFLFFVCVWGWGIVFAYCSLLQQEYFFHAFNML